MRMKILIRIFVFFIVLVVLGFLALYTYKKNRTAAYKQFFLEEACLAQSIFDKKGDLKLPDSPNITKDQVNVLVIDGGGAKGLYVLRVLEYLEEKTNKSISELYDVIGGTSVGSLLGATLSIPGEKGPKYTAKKLIPIFKKIGNNTLCPTFSHKVLSGFGYMSPLLENQRLIQELRHYTGDILLSECLNHLILYGFNLNSNKILIANNRGERLDSVNPVVYQLIGGTISPYGIAPANKVMLNSGAAPQLIADAGVIVNDPLFSIILTVSAQYPNKKLLVTHISLNPSIVKYDPNFPFYEGKIAGLAELPTMIVEGRNQLIRDYLDILSKKKLYAFDSLINIGIKEDNEWLLINPFDFSKRNLRKIDKFATKIIERNKDKLDKVVQELQKE